MTAAIIGLAIFLVLIFFGFPFAYSLGIVGLGGVIVFLGWDKTIELVPMMSAGFISNYAFGAVALFVLMGLFATESGITNDLFDVAYKSVGRLPGGLVTATILACTLFGAITGVTFSAIGALGKAVIGEMRKRGYDAYVAAASVAASANQGALIPPSILAVFYAFFMDISAGKQVMAGLIPGLITMVFYMVYVMVRATIKPAIAPSAKDIPWKESITVIPKLWGIVVVFALVVGGLYLGWFTTTEAAAVGTVLTFLILVIRKKDPWKPVKRSLRETVSLCGMIFILFLGAAVIKFFFSTSGFGNDLLAFIERMNLSTWQLSLMLAVPWLILGMFIDTMTIMLITLPVYKLVMVGGGVDLLIWGVLFVKLNGIAALTPPFGFNCILTNGIAPDIPLWGIYKETMWYVVLDIIIIALLVAFPEITHLIPDTM